GGRDRGGRAVEAGRVRGVRVGAFPSGSTPGGPFSRAVDHAVRRSCRVPPARPQAGRESGHDGSRGEGGGGDGQGGECRWGRGACRRGGGGGGRPCGGERHG
ncbi:unnamed protein product, partial [Ectocarpus sp. 12 AP-2014]